MKKNFIYDQSSIEELPDLSIPATAPFHTLQLMWRMMLFSKANIEILTKKLKCSRCRRATRFIHHYSNEQKKTVGHHCSVNFRNAKLTRFFLILDKREWRNVSNVMSQEMNLHFYIQVSWADRVSDLVVLSGSSRYGWNPEMNRSHGDPHFKALSAISHGDFETTVNLMKPIRYDLVWFN